jgi:hypothetical protein
MPLQPSLRTLPLAVLLVVLAARSASADVELTPTVGYRFDDYRCSGDQAVIAGQSIFPPRACNRVTARSDDGPVFGLVLAFDVRRHLQLELLASRQESELLLTSGVPTAVTPSGSFAPLDEPDFTVTHLQIGLSRIWGEGTVRPFAGVAVGASRVEADSPQRVVDFEDDVPSASLGAGVKLLFGKRLGLRLEGRGYWLDLPSELGGGFAQGDATIGLILRR